MQPPDWNDLQTFLGIARAYPWEETRTETRRCGLTDDEERRVLSA